MISRFIMFMTLAVLATSCRSSGGGASAPAPTFETGLFAVVAEGAPRGGDAKVHLRLAKGAGELNTIIAQLEYDASRMKLKSCAINPAVGEGTPAGKQLLSLEQQPGTLRAIVTGSVEPLPPESDVFSCAFAVAAGAPAGPTVVRVEGDVSDTDFVDHAFRGEATLVVQD